MLAISESVAHKQLAFRPQHKYIDKLRSIVRPGARWLDIGCGCKIAPDRVLLVEEQAAAFGSATLIGIDLDAAITEHPLPKRPSGQFVYHTPNYLYNPTRSNLVAVLTKTVEPAVSSSTRQR